MARQFEVSDALLRKLMSVQLFKKLLVFILIRSRYVFQIMSQPIPFKASLHAFWDGLLAVLLSERIHMFCAG